MPHLVILYTGQLDAEVNMTTLCRQMADAMLTVKDESGKQVSPQAAHACWLTPRHTTRWPMAARRVVMQAAQVITLLCT